MKKYQAKICSTEYLMVCAYGYHNETAHRQTVVAGSTSWDMFDNHVSIPKECPLEDYAGK